VNSATILVVEDERITAEDIRAGLRSVGYKVPVICSEGEDAVKQAQRLEPDLVLMDIK
jgi:CheY-like chemotaxis protein